MNRRTFLGTVPFLTPSMLLAQNPKPKHRLYKVDVAIIGGGTGGVAAALAAAKLGLKVILTDETDWLGGQLTSQGVPPDEHPWIESFGCTRLYRQFRNDVREYYHKHYPLTAEARAVPFLNPGNASVSKICHEPRVALAVLTAMLAPYVSSSRVQILLEHQAIGASKNQDRVGDVTLKDLRSGNLISVEAPYFIDATELGDLLPMTGTDFVTGFESQKETQEPHAPVEPQPKNHQAFTCCFAMDYIDGEDHTISKPEEYDIWKKYIPDMKPKWPGPLLSWEVSQYNDPTKIRRIDFNPTGPVKEGLNLWTYRRITDRKNFVSGTYPGDICLVNWPQNDYWLGNLCEVPEEEARKHLKRAKQLSLSLFYWMQTEAPRPDGKIGWKALRLRGDVLGTSDGLAKYPYIRESRRIKAEFTVLEQHVGTEARSKLLGKKPEEISAERFADSVGIGSYRIDLHPSSGGDNYIDVSSLPFQIPLGSLIPRQTENLLAACKNLGVTHITNGCYRLHPVEWNIGEAVGYLAAFCLQTKEPPRQIRKNPKLLASFQKLLRDNGVELEWPKLSPR